MSVEPEEIACWKAMPHSASYQIEKRYGEAARELFDFEVRKTMQMFDVEVSLEIAHETIRRLLKPR